MKLSWAREAKAGKTCIVAFGVVEIVWGRPVATAALGCRGTECAACTHSRETVWGGSGCEQVWWLQALVVAEKVIEGGDKTAWGRVALGPCGAGWWRLRRAGRW